MAIVWLKQGQCRYSEPVWFGNQVGRLTYRSAGRTCIGRLYFAPDNGPGVDERPNLIDKFPSWHEAKLYAEEIAEPVSHESESER